MGPRKKIPLCRVRRTRDVAMLGRYLSFPAIYWEMMGKPVRVSMYRLEGTQDLMLSPDDVKGVKVSQRFRSPEGGQRCRIAMPLHLLQYVIRGEYIVRIEETDLVIPGVFKA